MKKIVYIILSIVITGFYSCETDYDAEGQGVILEDVPKYVAYYVPGAGSSLAPIEVDEDAGDTGDDINVQIPGGTLSNVNVSYTFGGDAVFGVDFTVTGATSAGGTVTIDYNNTPNVDGRAFNEDIVVQILEDGVVDGEKTLTITLTSASNSEGDIVVGRAGTDLLKTATVIISDIDE
jgi:hypothetical protein